MKSDYILVDTNVVSYIFRGDPRSEQFDPYLLGSTPAISVQTLAELHFVALKNKWGKVRYEELKKAMRCYATLDIDALTAEALAKLAVHAQSAGRSMTTADLWILATSERWDPYRDPLSTYPANFSIGLISLADAGLR